MLKKWCSAKYLQLLAILRELNMTIVPFSTSHSSAIFHCHRKLCNSEKHQYGSIEAHHVFSSQPTNPATNFRSWRGGDLIDHDQTGDQQAQAVGHTWRQWQAEQGEISHVSSETADGDGVLAVETVILNYHGQA